MAGHFAVVLVNAGGIRCGLPATDVVELHRVVLITPLPGAPGVVEGVVDVRGSVVAVVDLRARLGLPRRPPVLSDHLVLVRVGTRTVALRVDRALGLVELSADVVETEGAAGDGRYSSGVARLADGLVLIHDLATLLSAEEATVLDVALADPDAAEDQTPP